jgi:hypothetical protein
MLKIDAEEKIAALMDSVSGLLCSEATRLQESTAATPCAVWVETQGGTIIVALRAVPDGECMALLFVGRCACCVECGVCSCRIAIGVGCGSLLVQLVCAFLNDYLQDLDVCVCAVRDKMSSAFRLERAFSC